MKPLFLFFVLLFSLGFSLSWAVTEEKLAHEEKILGGDFTLTDHNGEPFHLSQARGKVVLLFFGYTHCPAVCPTEMALLTNVLKSLGQDADKVQALLVSVDPERDTPVTLKKYLEPFHKNIKGLVGDTTALKKVTDAYNIKVTIPEHKQGDDYMVMHTANLYVINPQGKIDSVIPYGFPQAHVKKVVAEALGQISHVKALEPEQQLQSASTFKLPILDTQQYKKLEDYQGKALIVNFWASWCPPCRAELPSMNRAWQKVKDKNIEMLAVNVGEDLNAVQAFLKDYPIDFQVLHDETGDMMSQWKIKGLPATFVLNPKGEVVYKILGEREWDDEALLAQVEALL